MAHKMGSAPSQYFQGDGAKPRAQSHNLSYNSTGWVASAVLVNTLFHSVCLLIIHPHIRLSRDLSSSPHSYFVFTCLYALFFYSFKIFSSHHYVFIFGLVLPRSSSPAPTCIIFHLSPFHGGPLPVCISGMKQLKDVVLLCVRIWFIVFHWSYFINIYCFVYNYNINVLFLTAVC